MRGEGVRLREEDGGGGKKMRKGVRGRKKETSEGVRRSRGKSVRKKREEKDGRGGESRCALKVQDYYKVLMCVLKC